MRTIHAHAHTYTHTQDERDRERGREDGIHRCSIVHTLSSRCQTYCTHGNKKTYPYALFMAEELPHSAIRTTRGCGYKGTPIFGRFMIAGLLIFSLSLSQVILEPKEIGMLLAYSQSIFLPP